MSVDKFEVIHTFSTMFSTISVNSFINTTIITFTYLIVKILSFNYKILILPKVYLPLQHGTRK